MYVVPSEENPDDSYEPPPSEQEKKKIPSAFPISRGEYAGSYGSVVYISLVTAYLSVPTKKWPQMDQPILSSRVCFYLDSQVFSFQGI